MIRVQIPYRFVPEKKYVLEYLFSEVFEIDFSIDVSDKFTDYKIILSNNSSISFEDHFFQKLNSGKDIFSPSQDLIPTKITFSTLKFIPEKNIPVLFGRGEIVAESHNIHCGIDIIATLFFMLSRWEEVVCRRSDIHGRFPLEESLAYKNGFLNRPLVNEYSETLWRMLSFLDPSLKRKKREFNFLFTHDIDMLLKFGKGTVLKRLAGDLLKRRSVSLFFNDFFSYFSVLLGFSKDPYDTFDELMDLSESFGCKSEFYFMSGGNSIHDNKYDIQSKVVSEKMKKIKMRGHGLGIHYSYNALLEKALLPEEIRKLAVSTGIKVCRGRGHFLNIRIPQSFDILDENEIKYDSTVSFGNRCGFRAGVCTPYYPWSFKDRAKYKVMERPLVVMDTTLFEHLQLSDDDILLEIKYYHQIIKKYNGEFVLLIHNSTDMRGIKLFKQALNTEN